MAKELCISICSLLFGLMATKYCLMVNESSISIRAVPTHLIAKMPCLLVTDCLIAKNPVEWQKSLPNGKRVQHFHLCCPDSINCQKALSNSNSKRDLSTSNGIRALHFYLCSLALLNGKKTLSNGTRALLNGTTTLSNGKRAQPCLMAKEPV